nr:MAG TPA: hypothetical protein [Caudoviricetes sp.]
MGRGDIPWGCCGLFFGRWLFRRRDFWCLCWSGVLVFVLAGCVCVLVCWCVSCVRACVLVVACVRVFDDVGHVLCCVSWVDVSSCVWRTVTAISNTAPATG